MRMRNCKICGTLFESHNGKEVCSNTCAIERKKEQDQRGNYKRYHGLSGQLETKVCPICKKKFEGLRNKYCSENCSKIAQKIARKENFQNYYMSNREKQIAIVKMNKTLNMENKRGK